MKISRRFYTNLIFSFSMLALALTRVLFATSALSTVTSVGREVLWDFFAQIFSMGILPLSLYLILLKRKKIERPARGIFRDLGYGGRVSGRGWIIVLVISLLSTFIITCTSNSWYNLITFMGYRPAISSPEVKFTAATLILQIVLTGILPAVFEEFTHRGLLYSGYKNDKKPYTAVVLTALMFALMHTNVTQVVYTFVFGLIAGALVYTTKSIWPAMLYHFINNFVSVMRDFGRLNGGGFDFLNKMYGWLFGSAAGVAVACVLFIVILLMVVWLLTRLGVVETDRRERAGITSPREVVEVGKYDSVPLAFAMALTVIITIISFVWGIIR